MATEDKILDAVAAIFRTVDGLNPEAVYGIGLSVDGVKPYPDDIAQGGFPATVIAPGDDLRGGGAGMENQAMAVVVEIWAGDYTERAERLPELLRLKEPISAAVAKYSKGNIAVHQDPAVQSFGPGIAYSAIEGRQWNRGTPERPTPWYLVLPMEIPLVVRRNRTYEAL